MCHSPRTTLLLAGILVLLGQRGAGAVEAQSADAPDLRGVVLVTIDTLRADHVGAYGGPVETPGMDALAREGVLVEQAVTPIPTTGPAHASIFTGLHPWSHGTLNNAVALDADLTTLAESLQAAGVMTAAFVSSFMLDRRFGFGSGFDTFVFEADQEYAWRGKLRPGFWARGATTTQLATRWLDEEASSSSRPFFLWVHYFDPHTPYAPPTGYAVPVDMPVDLSARSLPGVAGGKRRLAQLIRAYRGEVRYADAQVARLVERLRGLGLLDRVAFIVTSDHGEGLGDHGALQHGVSVHEELIRVPLMIRAPGVAAGRRLQGAAQLEDLHPTILSALRVEVPSGLDGVDLLPWLRGERDTSPREASYGRRKVYSGRDTLYFSRRWPEKWIGSASSPGVHYGLDADPRELSPRAATGAPPDLAEKIGVRPTVASEKRAPIPDEESRRALEALGYLE